GVPVSPAAALASPVSAPPGGGPDADAWPDAGRPDQSGPTETGPDAGTWPDEGEQRPGGNGPTDAGQWPDAEGAGTPGPTGTTAEGPGTAEARTDADGPNGAAYTDAEVRVDVPGESAASLRSDETDAADAWYELADHSSATGTPAPDGPEAEPDSGDPGPDA